MRQYRFGTGFAQGVARSFVGWGGISAVLAAGLAGCSADVIRLDSPARFGFADSASGLSRPQAPMSRSGAGIGSVDPSQSSTYAPPPVSQETVRMAALPDVPPATPAPSYTPPPSTPSYKSSGQPSGAKAVVPVAPAAAAERGEAIEVKPGDTLYGLSKRHHVAVSELMSVNALTTPNLKPGQTLYLPAGASAGRRPIARQSEVAIAPAPAASVAHAAPVQLSAETIARYDGSYTVKKGDSLYGLALQFHLQPAELQQVNGIADVRKVRPGAVLKVPASALAALPAQPAVSAPAVAPAVPSVAAASAEPAVKVPPQVVAAAAASTTTGGPQSVLLNGEKKVATAEMTANDAQAAGPAAVDKAAPVASAGGDAGAGLGRLRWPVKGRVIGTFGARPDGTHNDGVNFQVPLGTEVHAAEGGVVAYAGSELKGYGNLILVRHDNGWITAYAHNEEILAKRGDKVKRGQIIAKAGKSGQVDQPQVHFELRQGSKPVDPTPFMEKI